MTNNNKSFRFEIDGEGVPKVFINDVEVGVVTLSYQYGTSGTDSDGVCSVMATVVTKDTDEQSVFHCDLISKETFYQ